MLCDFADEWVSDEIQETRAQGRTGVGFVEVPPSRQLEVEDVDMEDVDKEQDIKDLFVDVQKRDTKVVANISDTQCHGCGDFGTLWKCINCSAQLCVDKKLQTSCIIFHEQRPVDETAFMCPRCYIAAGVPIPYNVDSYCSGNLVQALSTFIPLCVFNLLFEKKVNTINRVCQLSQLVRHYSSDADKFKEIVVQMSKKNSEPVNLDKIRVPFLRHFKQAVSVANGQGHFLGAFETHINERGWMCAGYVEDNKNKLYEELLVYPIDKLIDIYYGNGIKNVLKNLQGFRVLLLLTCGKAFTNLDHFEKIKSLTLSGAPFTHVIGFSAPCVVPNLVMPFIELALALSFTRNIDPWLCIMKNVTGNPWTLTSSPIVVVKGGLATQLVYSSLPYKPWGITPTCSVCKQPVKVVTSGHGNQLRNHERLIFQCPQWQCGLKKIVERPAFVMEIQDRPHFFHYPYPLTRAQSKALGCH